MEPHYTVLWLPRAEKAIGKLPVRDQQRIEDHIEDLAITPRPDGCKKLRGMEDVWRIRVGDFRVIYEVDDTARRVIVMAVVNRKDAY